MLETLKITNEKLNSLIKDYETILLPLIDNLGNITLRNTLIVQLNEPVRPLPV